MRKLTILAAAAITAMAMMAMATSAQAHHSASHVEVSDASTGELCPALNGPFDGGCVIEDMWGEYTIDGQTCEHYYDFRVGPDGEFYAENHRAWVPSGCHIAPCDQGTANDPWPGQVAKFLGTVYTGTEVCFQHSTQPWANYEWDAAGTLATVMDTETEHDIPRHYPGDNGNWTFEGTWQGAPAIEVVQATP